MAMLTIGEVARRANLATSALRYYEAEGLLPRAAREGGRRVYDVSILDRLQLIELAKSAGFSVAEIKRLLGGFTRRTTPGERWRRLAETKHAELEQRIAEAQRMKQVLETVMGCECPTFEDCTRAMDEGGCC